MPSTARWPDFLSASKLRHFMGTQSSVSDGVATDKSSSFPGGLGREDNYLDDPEAAGFDEHMAALSDAGEQQIEVTEAEGFEDYPNEEAGDDADADFGDLQVFDSNAPPPSIPAETSQLVESVGNSPPPESASRRTKKKKSRAKADAVAEAEAAELEASAGKKRKRSKRKSSIDLGVADGHEQDHGWPHMPATELSQSFVDVEAATSDMRAHEVPNLLSTEKKKKKRRTSDLEDGKRRKKRKPHDLEVEDDVPASQGGDLAERHAGFLRTDRHDDVDVLDAIDEDRAQDPDSQLSPSVARLRRRSLSAGLRSRENSVPPRAAIAPMAVDGLSQDMGPSNNENTDHADEDDEPEAVVAVAEDDVDVDVEVEDMVREAWREHVSTQQEERHDETEEQDAEGEEHEENPMAEPSILVNPAPEQHEEKPKKRRHTKKQKPPMDETAVTEEASSNPKARGKIATKRSRGRPPKQQKAPSAAQEEEKVEEEEEEGEEGRHYTKGRFSDAEFSRLTTTLENFRVEHGLTQVELNSMIHAPGGTTAGHAHAELWQRLSAECPNRKRQKIINVTRKRFHNFVARGTWTIEQDEELTKLIDEHGTAWSKIAAIINRHPEDVRDRYRNYIVCGSSQRKDVWTQEEQDLLRHHINEAMEAVDDLRRQSPDQILLQKSYEELIDWQNISEKMGRTRSRLQCITKWKALNNRTPRRKAPERKRNGEPRFSQAELDGSAISKLEVARQKLETMSEDERYRLVMAIQQSGVTESAKIPWAKLLDKDFRKNWSRTCRLLLWHRLKQSVPEFEEKSVQEITQYLIDHYGQTGGFPQLDPSYDFQREVEIVRRLRPREASMQQKKENFEPHHGSGDETQTKSAKLVAGDEDDLDMNIDPALSQMHVAGVEEKPMSSRRQSSKTAIEEEDPIEDVDSGGEGGGMKKAGRPGKKSGRDYRIAISDKNGNDGFGTPYMSSSDSEMANLMDLPARI